MLGTAVQGLGFKVWSLGLGVYGLWFMIYDLVLNVDMLPPNPEAVSDPQVLP